MVSFGANEMLTSYNAVFTFLRTTSELIEFYVEFYATFLSGLYKLVVMEGPHFTQFDSLRLPEALKCTRAHMLESTYVYFVFVDIYLWVNSRVPIFCQVKYRLFILMEFSQLTLMSSTYSTWRVGQCIHKLVPVNHSGCE